jgi:hypothetical protein
MTNLQDNRPERCAHMHIALIDLSARAHAAITLETIAELRAALLAVATEADAALADDDARRDASAAEVRAALDDLTQASMGDLNAAINGCSAPALHANGRCACGRSSTCGHCGIRIFHTAGKWLNGSTGSATCDSNTGRHIPSVMRDAEGKVSRYL